MPYLCSTYHARIASTRMLVSMIMASLLHTKYVTYTLRVPSDQKRGRVVASPLCLVVISQEFAHSLHDAVFGIDAVEKLRPIQRVAGEEAFVDPLSATKGTTG